MISGIRNPDLPGISTSCIKSSTVRQRFYVYGWTIKRSLGMED